MFCKKCGVKNDDDAKFCGKCGSGMNGDVVAAKEELSPSIVGVFKHITKNFVAVNTTEITFSADGRFSVRVINKKGKDISRATGGSFSIDYPRINLFYDTGSSRAVYGTILDKSYTKFTITGSVFDKQ